LFDRAQVSVSRLLFECLYKSVCNFRIHGIIIFSENNTSMTRFGYKVSTPKERFEAAKKAAQANNKAAEANRKAMTANRKAMQAARTLMKMTMKK
jgi:hypothetical protein